jgi:hypothetical protein
MHEYHCIKGESVVGTYGMFGYFQGKYDPATKTAYVNWWETTTMDDGLLPSSGSATLTYSELGTSVVGPFWSSGSIDVFDSWGTWNATNGTQLTADKDSLKNYCFVLSEQDLPPTLAKRDQLPVLHKSYWESEQGQSQFCVTPLTHITGEYSYTYSTEEMSDLTDDASADNVEEGSYKDPLIFTSSLGQGLVTVWEAKTGPVVGAIGTSIYIVVKDAGENKLLGFYCWVNDDFEREGCVPEEYTYDASKKASLCLSTECPSVDQDLSSSSRRFSLSRYPVAAAIAMFGTF